jgi:hypothetical protein
MDKNICFNKNTFIIGIFIIMIIIFILSYFINFNFNFDKHCNANIYNLINKKILNIKDKIIKNKINNNYNKQQEQKEENITKQNYQDYNEQEQNYIKKQDYNEQEQKEENITKQNYQDNIKKQNYQDYNEQEQKEDNIKKQNYQDYNEQEQKEKNKNIYGYRNNINESDGLIKYKLDNTVEDKHFNYRNNINDRINERDDLIKYKLDNTVEQRDLNVLLNPIYPPLGRVERPTFDNLLKMKIGETTRGSEDTFRLIGYLVNTNKNDIDMGNNIWKLFGRQTYRGSSIGEFYVSPVNEHKTDMKIFLKNEMMPKEKIRDLYALPNVVYLDSPFFSKNPYTLNELPKSDFNSNYL